MPTEPLSPELALVDPELRARARAALPTPAPGPTAPARSPSVVTPAPAGDGPEVRTRYPAWARVTALLWVLTLGILIGGAAIPHAQDRPRVVPPAEDAIFCELPDTPETPDRPPTGPLNPSGNR